FFDGTNDGMLFSGTDYLTSNGFSVNLVAGSNASSNGGRRAVQGSSVGNNWLVGPYTNAHTWFAGGFNHLQALPWSTTQVERFTIIQPTSNPNTSFRNGSSITTDNNKSTRPGTLNLGASGGFAEPLDGFISEVVSYATELNTTDIQSMETSQATYYTPCTPTASTFTVAACGSYNWAAKGNKQYTASNTTDTIMLKNAAGCDSIVTLNLTINVGPAINSITPVSVCVGSPITINVDSTATQVQWQLNGSTVSTNNSLTANPATTTTVAGTGIAGSNANQLNTPFGVAIDSAGNIYVADRSNHRIQKWAVGATLGTTVAGGFGQGINANQLNNPNDVAIDAAGNIYVADYSNHRIQKWAVGANVGTTVAGGNGLGNNANQLYRPNGVAVDSAGNILYVADYSNHRIQKWAVGATTGTTVAGTTGIEGSADNRLWNPSGVAIDSSGNIYVADYVNHRIQKWAVGATTGTTVAGNGISGNAANQLNLPAGVFVDAVGNIYVADKGNHRIQKWAVGATTGTTVA
ncbi:MAG: NHL repeat-containing protein, partial [Chitinophagaceae bacterium]